MKQGHREGLTLRRISRWVREPSRSLFTREIAGPEPRPFEVRDDDRRYFTYIAFDYAPIRLIIFEMLFTAYAPHKFNLRRVLTALLLWFRLSLRGHWYAPPFTYIIYSAPAFIASPPPTHSRMPRLALRHFIAQSAGALLSHDADGGAFPLLPSLPVVLRGSRCECADMAIYTQYIAFSFRRKPWSATKMPLRSLLYFRICFCNSPLPNGKGGHLSARVSLRHAALLKAIHASR